MNDLFFKLVLSFQQLSLAVFAFHFGPDCQFFIQIEMFEIICMFEEDKYVDFSNCVLEFTCSQVVECKRPFSFLFLYQTILSLFYCAKCSSRPR